MLEAFPTLTALAEAAAGAVLQRLKESVAERGRATMAATGGRSPGPVYDRLMAEPIDWPRVAVTLSDERFVPPEHPDANACLVRERLLTGAAVGARFVPLWSDKATAEDAALAADGEVRGLLPFDAVLLGMGEDGHVASLFPGSALWRAGADPACERYVLGSSRPLGSPALPRITLTLRALLEARMILLLIAGDAKREVAARAFAGADLPVRSILVQDRAPVRVLWSPSHEG